MLATGQLDGILAARYGELFQHIAALPGSPPVDIENVLRGYVSAYIHELQGLVVNKPDWTKLQISDHFSNSQTRIGKLISLITFERPRVGEFRAVLEISGSQKRRVEVSHETNAGMRRFTFQPAQTG